MFVLSFDINTGGQLVKNLECLLKNGKIEYRKDEDVSRYSTFKIGGVSAFAVFPSSADELCTAIKSALECGIKYEVVGNASNVLFAFDRYEGAIIFTSKIFECELEGDRIYAAAGVTLPHLSAIAKKAELSGFEFACGIPGRVGGSVYMNAGAHGSAISDVIEYSDAFDTKSGERIRVFEHNFDYRNSIYMQNKNLICLGASFKLVRSSENEIEEKIRQNIEKRKASQPLEYPSAGSYFKRPEGDFAGRLIEACGLKGERVGDAEVSEKHAGFIINRGNATYSDVLALEEKIKERVMSSYGVMLCREVRLIEN